MCLCTVRAAPWFFPPSLMARRARARSALTDSRPARRLAESDIYAPGFRSLAEGEPVEFRMTTDKNGKTKAVDVTGPDGAYVQGAPREPRYDDEY